MMAIDSFNQLISKLESSLPEQRKNFVVELRKYDHKSLIPELIEIIKESKDNTERIDAIKGLRWLGNRNAIGDLKYALLHDDSNDVRIAIIDLIGVLREKSMINTLIKIVNRDDDPKVIKACSIAIQVIQGVTDASSMDLEY